MLPSRSQIQQTRTSVPTDEKAYSTKQADYDIGVAHGNLVLHSGNAAYLKPRNNTTNADKQSEPIASKVKPFLAPTYNNLASQSMVANRFSDGYSNNYRTSDEHPLKRNMRNPPVQLKLGHLWKVKTAPIARPDQDSIYGHEYMQNYKHDHFVSKKPIKTETVNLRDTLACLMEVADYFRNKSFDVNARNSFQGPNNSDNSPRHLEACGTIFSQLIRLGESLLLVYNKLHLSAVELKQMCEDYRMADVLVDKNLWDRSAKPEHERSTQLNTTEKSIAGDRMKLASTRATAQKIIGESHVLEMSIERSVHKDLEELVEEARVLLMFKLCNNDYERIYLRDSNGYIKSDHKLPIAINGWFSMANKWLMQGSKLQRCADDLDRRVNEIIQNTNADLTTQFISTHQTATNQVEQTLKDQSKMISNQYDLNKELSQLDASIVDTKLKKRVCEMYNEVLLTQLEAPVSEIGPHFDERRGRQQFVANKIWTNSRGLNANFNNMLTHRADLNDRIARLRTNLFSNHVGVNHDLQTIVGPRRHTVGAHPSPGFATKSLYNLA